MKAYMDALLQKELRLLPEDAPRRWQIDAALNYILPAIAIQTRRKGGGLDREQLLETLRVSDQAAESAVKAAHARLEAHLKNIASELMTEEQRMQQMLEQISMELQADGELAEAAQIDDLVTMLTEREDLNQSIVTYFDNRAYENEEGSHE